jgi:hypothetical protein
MGLPQVYPIVTKVALALGMIYRLGKINVRRYTLK